MLLALVLGQNFCLYTDECGNCDCAGRRGCCCHGEGSAPNSPPARFIFWLDQSNAFY